MIGLLFDLQVDGIPVIVAFHDTLFFTAPPLEMAFLPLDRLEFIRLRDLDNVVPLAFLTTLHLSIHVRHCLYLQHFYIQLIVQVLHVCQVLDVTQNTVYVY